MSKDSSLTATDAYVCTPSDINPNVGNAFYVGGAGNVTVVSQRNEQSGQTTLFSAVPIGTVIRLHFCKIMATGTSATLITVMRS